MAFHWRDAKCLMEHNHICTPREEMSTMCTAYGHQKSFEHQLSTWGLIKALLHMNENEFRTEICSPFKMLWFEFKQKFTGNN